MKSREVKALPVAGAPDRSAADKAKADRRAAGDGQRELPQAFPFFFQAEWPRLKAYLRRFVSSDEAEELAQEAFTRVYAAREVRSPNGLLYRTARNLLIDRSRRQRTSGVIDVKDEVAAGVPDPNHSPEDQVVLRERLARAQLMLDQMPARCRETFLLQVIDGMSYAEIAKRQGVSVVAVKKQLLKAFEICARHARREGDKRHKRRERSSK